VGLISNFSSAPRDYGLAGHHLILDFRFSTGPQGEHHADPQTNERSTNINHHITRRCGPRRNERLMKFVGGGKNRAHKPDHDHQDRHLHSQICSPAQCAPEEYREEGVFRRVPELANKKMNLRERLG